MKKVYLIRAAQFYKIGISANITKRLAQVQTGCPIKCEYVGYFPSPNPEELEKHLHLTFQDFKTWGEWFDLGDDNVRRLITEYTLKHQVNPYAEVTEEMQRTSTSPALKEARDLSAQVNEIDQIFIQTFGDSCLNDNGKSQVRKLILKYGYQTVALSINHLASKFDAKMTYDKLQITCKTHHTYGRFITDRTWSAYRVVVNDFGRECGSDMLRHVMTKSLDLQPQFRLIIGGDTLLHADDNEVYLAPTT